MNERRQRGAPALGTSIVALGLLTLVGGCQAGSSIEGAQTDEAELREFARASLAHFKAPHSVTFVKELPKTATGRFIVKRLPPTNRS